MLLILSMGIGIITTISLYGILDALGVDYTKYRQGKFQCWVYISILMFGLCVLSSALAM